MFKISWRHWGLAIGSGSATGWICIIGTTTGSIGLVASIGLVDCWFSKYLLIPVCFRIVILLLIICFFSGVNVGDINDLVFNLLYFLIRWPNCCSNTLTREYCSLGLIISRCIFNSVVSNWGVVFLLNKDGFYSSLIFENLFWVLLLVSSCNYYR